MRFVSAGLGLAFALLADHAGAANQWWDNNGASTPTSGLWDTNTASWTISTSSNLTASPVVFTNGNFPEFAAGSGTITALTINVPGPVLCAGMADGLNAAAVTTLTFTNAGPIIITNGLQGFYCGGSGSDLVVFKVPLTGSGELQQHSSGALALEATNTYTGGTAVTGGQVIYYYYNGSFGTGPISIGGTGNALLNNTVPEVALTVPNAFAFPTINYALNLAGGNPVGGAPGTTFTGAFTLPASGCITLETSSTATELTEIAGAISGVSALAVSDAGILALAGTNTFTGGLGIVSPATLWITNSGSLGSGIYAGPITNNSKFIYATSAMQTNSGVISGLGTLVKSGTGILTLSGVNTYTNTTTLNAGEIDLASSAPLGTGGVIINGGQLASINAARSLANKFTIAGSFTLGGSPNTSPQATTLTGAINLNGQATNTITLGNNATFGGAVTNGGLSVNAGNNTLTLTNAANTYTGATTITGTGAGGLTIATAGTLGGGTYAGLITNNGTFSYNSTAAETLAGAISGAGTLVQNGPGALTLSSLSPNDTGLTMIDAGELIGITGDGVTNSVVTVANGATNSILINNLSTPWSCGGLTFNAGAPTLDFNFGYTVSPSTTLAPLYVNGAVTFTGTPTVTVEAGGIPPGAGTYPLMTWASVSGTPPSTVILPPHVAGSLSVSGNTLYLNVTANTQPLYWTDAAGNGLWDINTSQNWDDNTGTPAYYLQTPLPGDAVVLNETYVTVSQAITLNTVVSPASVVVSNTIYNYALSGTGGIAGGASLVKLGGGSLMLASSNSYTGGTLCLGGTLIVGSDTNLGATVSSLVLSNTTLSLTNTFTMNASRGVTMLTDTIFDTASGKQLTFDGDIAGPANLIKTDSGTLVLGGGLNSFTGGVIVDSGILQTGGDQHTGGVAANLGITPSTYEPTNITLAGGTLEGNNPNFALNINRGIVLLANSGLNSLSGSMTGVPGVIMGNYGLTIANHGVGIVYFTGTNTYTGSTLITGGTLSLQTNGSIASSSVSIGAGTVFDVSKLVLTNYVMGGSAFSASGTGTATNLAATLNGATNGSVSLGSLPVYLTYTPATVTGDATNPSLYVLSGSLVLNSNSFTVTNASGTPLGVGTYVLIQQNGGAITNAGSFMVTVAGSGLVADGAATISVSGATVDLIVTQQGPVIANTVTNNVPAGYLWQEAVTTLASAAGWSSPSSNSLTLASVGPLSADGTNVTTDGTNIYYGGPVTAPDSFNYTISDGSLTATGTVYLAPVTAPVVSISTPALNASGSPMFSGTAAPGYTYGVESTTNLLGLWIEAGTVTTDTNGVWNFTDSNQTNPATLFYRLYYPDDAANPPQ